MGYYLVFFSTLCILYIFSKNPFRANWEIAQYQDTSFINHCSRFIKPRTQVPCSDSETLQMLEWRLDCCFACIYSTSQVYHKIQSRKIVFQTDLGILYCIPVLHTVYNKYHMVRVCTDPSARRVGHHNWFQNCPALFLT